ncbi:MAG: tRNA (adenosine(37)-N6)-threonylcarbamoyltransferase complex dimerization subunit type 1 TsaB [Flavobacteriaceae bacterium]
MYILNIETATKNCSAAISKSGKTIALKEMAEEHFSHSEKLHLFIDSLLQENQIAYKDLSAVALSSGPGSYTGLRIGTSTAKGLCFALDIPLISVDTLLILAKQVSENSLIIPMLDARRMEVYTAIFDENHHRTTPVQALVVDENSFVEITEKAVFIGDGATKCKEILNRENFIFLDDIRYPSAGEMSAISFDKFQKKEFEDMAYFEPFYLKEFFTGAKKS